ncbi:MAG: hypothetical protein ACXWQ5_00680 [Ktedonobacterales bacterium]
MTFFSALRTFFVGAPPPPREAKDCAVLRIWEDYEGQHVAIDRGTADGSERGDIFFVVNPHFKIEVTHPETGAVLTTYYKNAFKIWAERAYKTWTSCRVDGEDIDLNLIPAAGNVAVFQYNIDRWIANPKATNRNPRFP